MVPIMSNSVALLGRVLPCVLVMALSTPALAQTPPHVDVVFWFGEGGNASKMCHNNEDGTFLCN